jgi:acetolactate decarboxylase
MKQILSIFLIITLLFSCKKEPVITDPLYKNTLVQVSVIDALLQGFYDGYYPINQLKLHGNYGIGTFHALDGEMVFFNDTVYQVLASGEVTIANDTLLTPFAAVAPWVVTDIVNLTSFSFDQLKEGFDSLFPTRNIFYLVKIKGDFSYVRTRSVPAQQHPYPPLIEVTANQPEFEFENVKGDIVGFYCPPYAQGVNVVGLHLHFLTSNRSGGGHLLDFKLKSGQMEIGNLYDYRLILPEHGDFFGGDFSIDRSDEVEKIER